MQDQRAVQDAIAAHDPLLRCIKDEILDLNERLDHLSIQEKELSLSGTQNSEMTVNNAASDLELTRFTLLSKIRERIELEETLDLYKSVSAPAHLLPFEIWAQIFLLCTPDTRYPRWDAQFAPVTSISLETLPGIENKWPKWMSRLHNFLRRSADQPLSVRIVWYQSQCGPREQATFRAYLSDLIASSTRWRDVDLTVPSGYLHPFLEANLPILETFTFGSDDELPLNLPHAPRLHTVIFSGYYIRPLTWNIPWSQLTELGSKSMMSVKDVKRILKQCPHLEYFHLSVSGRPLVWLNFVAIDAEMSDIVTLRKLKKFTMIISHDEDALEVLRQFNFPKLEEIRFSGTQSRARSSLDYSIMFWPIILALISTSGCTIRKLVIEDFPTIKDREIHELLDHIPSLTELEVTCKGSDILEDTFKDILMDRRKEALLMN
ncbi:hypothetical protein L218DRAFT_988297 [Marasmius fiardii PR-910]|nr:hypothetical protein L218DRAFT_988297 [Marasmius fiardii PR-910]